MDERQRDIRQYRKTINELEGTLLELYRNLGRSCLSAATVPPELSLWRNELDEVLSERDSLASRRHLIEETRSQLNQIRVETLALHTALREHAKALPGLHARMGAALLDAAPAMEIPALQLPMLRMRSFIDEKARLDGIRLELEHDKVAAPLLRRWGSTAKALALSLSRAHLESKYQRACASLGAVAAENPVLLECSDGAVCNAQQAIHSHVEENVRLRRRLDALEAERKTALAILSDANAEESPRRALLQLDALDQAAKVREDRIYADCAQELVRLFVAHRKKRSAELAAFLQDPATAALLEDQKRIAGALGDSDKALQKAHRDERLQMLREQVAVAERQVADHKRRIAASELALRDLERQQEKLRMELSELEGGSD